MFCCRYTDCSSFCCRLRNCFTSPCCCDEPGLFLCFFWFSTFTSCFILVAFPGSVLSGDFVSVSQLCPICNHLPAFEQLPSFVLCQLVFVMHLVCQPSSLFENQTMDQHLHSNTDQTPEDTSKEEHPLQAQKRDQNPESLKGHQGHKLPVAGPVPGHYWTEHQGPDQAQNDVGSVPVLLITQTEVPPLHPVSPSGPAELLLCTEPSLSSRTDSFDLLSLKSVSVSLCSEPVASRRSDEDDTSSVTASSFLSLFHRVQLDPLEKDWMRCSAAGNMDAQHQLFVQEPSLLFKKTALHWAAKQGHQEAVGWMVDSGADVNARCGYTALHLACIHGHQHVVHALIHSHNAQTDIRDYHGKKAVHYWTGSRIVFHKPDSRSRGSFSSGWRTQRYVLPSVLLSHSRSHGQLNLELGMVPQSAYCDTVDLQL
ncbi:ankyrin repeat domain-containing protein SOWAHC isoform X2 [Betta splendens]|uniref:Ankyrin repeat domain-containing protein SOWAHC isoform X2 n=1 Tax=Betta splendens TaxID=158456 RepID=A0A9W2XV97_BETSP|nr:ankyrin repeat domain-containing protein SOWAHC isoform X2 [Betta splendens]